MAQIINLRQARKARKRGEAEQQAAENRAKYGRTKAQKASDRREAEQRATELDGKRLEPDE